MTFVEFLIYCFGAWRIARFLADDNEGGPWDVFHRFRNLVGVEYDQYSAMVGTNVISRLIICPYCSSFWIGVIAVILHYFGFGVYIFAPFAISGFVVLIVDRLWYTD